MRKIGHYICARRSGGEAHDSPAAIRLAAVLQPVMQARRAALPELHARGQQTVAAPVRRARRRVAKALAVFGFARFERGAVGHFAALLGGPGAQPRAERARVVVGVALLLRNLFHHALDAHLALQPDPVEEQRRMGVGGQFRALVAGVVGEEGEAALVQVLEQHDAGGRLALRVDGGERHGIDLGHLGLERLVKPAAELAQGVGIDVREVEGFAGVFGTDIGDGSHGVNEAHGGRATGRV